MVRTASMHSGGELERQRTCSKAKLCVDRIAEAQLRSMNNLLERLHASYFLYLMPEPFHFLSVASYLSAPILIGASLTMAGLRIWRRAPSNTAMPALAVMAACILSGTTALHVRENLVSAVSN